MRPGVKNLPGDLFSMGLETDGKIRPAIAQSGTSHRTGR
jgi:hypothetical protein